MQNNPFMDIDFVKMMSEYKFPGVDMDQIMASQRRNVEALTKANQVAVEGAQAVARRQAEILRQTLDNMSKMAGEMMVAGANPQEKMSKQADLIKVALDTAMKNMKELADLITKSNQEAFDHINKRMNEIVAEVQTVMEQAKPK